MPAMFTNLTLRFTLLRIVCASTILLLLMENLVRIKPTFEAQDVFPISVYFIGLGLVLVHHIASAFGPRFSLPGLLDLLLVFVEIGLCLPSTDVTSRSPSHPVLDFALYLIWALVLIALLRIGEAIQRGPRYLWTRYDITGAKWEAPCRCGSESGKTRAEGESPEPLTAYHVLIGTSLWRVHFSGEIFPGVLGALLIIVLVIGPIFQTGLTHFKGMRSHGPPQDFRPSDQSVCNAKLWIEDNNPDCSSAVSVSPLWNSGSVSFTPSNVEARSIELSGTITPSSLLSHANRNYKNGNELFQSSFPKTSDNIFPSANGFTQTIIDAYNNHHALIIRPDDVWLAILVQFSFFVNGNAELLRSQFVAHEGKKRLVVKANGSRYTVDFGHMSRSMANVIQENIVDPSLRAWILPEFSTTTITDTTVYSIIMMATLKEYFSYEFSLLCGIPRVTLEGEKRDWENIQERLEKLKEYGVETVAWYHLLVPVISRFVKAFDDPNGKENIGFWQRVAHYHGGGSGPTWLSGWITAFCVFNPQGKWIGGPFKTEPKIGGANATSLSTAEFFETYMVTPEQQPFGLAEKSLILDDMPYHLIDTDDIPPGYAEVDVLLVDNGLKIDCMMTAGLVGSKVDDSKDFGLQLHGSGVRDVVRPLAGWWMYEKPDESSEVRPDFFD